MIFQYLQVWKTSFQLGSLQAQVRVLFPLHSLSIISVVDHKKAGLRTLRAVGTSFPIVAPHSPSREWR